MQQVEFSTAHDEFVQIFVTKASISTGENQRDVKDETVRWKCLRWKSVSFHWLLTRCAFHWLNREHFCSEPIEPQGSLTLVSSINDGNLLRLLLLRFDSEVNEKSNYNFGSVPTHRTIVNLEISDETSKAASNYRNICRSLSFRYSHQSRARWGFPQASFKQFRENLTNSFDCFLDSKFADVDLLLKDLSRLDRAKEVNFHFHSIPYISTERTKHQCLDSCLILGIFIALVLGIHIFRSSHAGNVKIRIWRPKHNQNTRELVLLQQEGIAGGIKEHSQLARSETMIKALEISLNWRTMCDYPRRPCNKWNRPIYYGFPALHHTRDPRTFLYHRPSACITSCIYRKDTSGELPLPLDFSSWGNWTVTGTATGRRVRA